MDYQLASPEFYLGDPAPAYRALRHRSPVHWTDANGGFWAISRYEDVRCIGARPQLFSWEWTMTEPVHDQTKRAEAIPDATLTPGQFGQPIRPCRHGYTDVDDGGRGHRVGVPAQQQTTHRETKPENGSVTNSR
ncbi:hypothetical protein [Actinophytocola glycyrrhizae]|uniref:Cytochrome P450 n=1 Tax=Actinophytocola glycyrrhizae TaxID=2044873 RepID=A0ABV9S6C1_9PSEU